MSFNKIVLALDFETQMKDHKPKVVAFSSTKIYQEKIDKNSKNLNFNNKIIEKINEETFYYDNDGEDVTTFFFSYLTEFFKQGYKKVYGYFHNLKGYDGFFIMPYLRKNLKNVPLEVSLANGEYHALHINNAIMELTLKLEQGTLIFKDTLPFFNMSIAKIGKIIGIEKLETDYEIDLSIKNKQYWNYVEYTKRDTKILAEFFWRFSITNECDISNYITTASYAYRYFEDRFNKYLHLTKLNSKNDWSTLQLGYYGGYTILNPEYQGKIVKNLYYQDENSAYPFAMTKPLACGKLYNSLSELLNDNYCKCEKEHTCYTIYYHIDIISGSVKQDLQPIIRNPAVKNIERSISNLYRKQGHFIKEVTTPFEYYVFKEELDYFEKFYDNFKYTINSKWFMVKKVIFREFVQEMYNKKNYHSQYKNKDIEHFILTKYFKDLQNSTYGKYGESIYKEQFFFTDKELKVGHHLTFNEEKRTFGSMYLKGKWEIRKVNKNKYNNLFKYTLVNTSTDGKIMKNIGTASFITLLARLRIYDQILDLKDKFVYCDTDSVISFGTTVNPIELDNNKLGAFKIEYENVAGYFIKQKQYILQPTAKKLKAVIAGYSDTSAFDGVDIEALETKGFKLIKTQGRKTEDGVIIEKTASTLYKGIIYKGSFDD